MIKKKGKKISYITHIRPRGWLTKSLNGYVVKTLKKGKRKGSEHAATVRAIKHGG